jgi:23S rRNA (cytosine1962-C5)-methyltransferase
MTATAAAVVHLKPGRDKSLRRWHPWVFSGAIARVTGTPNAGDTVMVTGANGVPLGLGAYSPHSQIRVRLWTFDPHQGIDAEFLADAVAASVARRGVPDEGGPNEGGLWARRLVNAENDGLPGLIVDRYGDHLVAQILAAGCERWKEEIADALLAVTGCAGLYERSDADVRIKEGLSVRSGHWRGVEAPDLVEIAENGLRLLVDVRNGHKTGFYLDQRASRARVAQLAGGREVLNCFAYTGGFGVAALKGGAAHATHLDSSGPSLALADRNGELNGIDRARWSSVEADAFAKLRQWHQEGRTFDLIVLDPPKFVESRQHLPRGCRGYKDINMQALKLLRPGGLLVTFSCSGLLEADLFQKIVADAALDAGRRLQLIGHLGQADDHPVLMSFPEGAYLKGLVCRVD